MENFRTQREARAAAPDGAAATAGTGTLAGQGSRDGTGAGAGAAGAQAGAQTHPANPAPYTLARLGALAADCLARAVARGVHAATPWPGSDVRCWTDVIV